MELRDVMHIVRASLTFVQVSPPWGIVSITNMALVYHMDARDQPILFRQENVKRQKISVARNILNHFRCTMTVNIIVQADASALPEEVRIA